MHKYIFWYGLIKDGNGLLQAVFQDGCMQISTEDNYIYKPHHSL
jgi:hypothetical protein